MEKRGTGFDEQTANEMAGMGIIYPDPKELTSRLAKRAVQIIEKAVDPIIKNYQEKQKEIQRKDKKIKEQFPHAKRGKKVLQGAKKSGKDRNQIFRTLNPLYQRAANKIWDKHPRFFNTDVGREIAKKINTLIEHEEESWDEKNPLSEIAALLSVNKMKANPDTIRRNIKKPSLKTRK